MSVEDEGAGITFHIYAYNNQPGVQIDYATGDSSLVTSQIVEDDGDVGNFVLNISSKKFHLQECVLAQTIKLNNRQEYTGYRQQLLDQGYTPCGGCEP